MTKGQPQIAFEVGFPYIGELDNVYLHRDREGCPYAYTISLSHPDGTPYSNLESSITPHTLEDLVAGRVEYGLLPWTLRGVIEKIARYTYQAILDEKPEEAKKIDPRDPRVLFHIENISRVLQ